MFQTLNLVCDSSTLANFKSWAQSISAWFATAGWLQSSDTGQVNWSTLASVPGSNAYVYEIWEPNDGLTNFFLKIEYGNCNSANSPSMRLTIGTATNGAGALTGDLIGPYRTMTNSSPATPGGVLLFPCYFSGAAGRMSIVMWRNATNGYPQVIAIERSLNAAGTYTNTHVTLMPVGLINDDPGSVPYNQQTLVFGVGAAPAQSTANSSLVGGLAVRSFFPGSTSASSDFDGAVPFDTTAPCIGFFDYPLTSLGWGNQDNYTEGQVFTTTLYGSSRTYVATKTAPFQKCGPAGSAGYLCVRYD